MQGCSILQYIHSQLLKCLKLLKQKPHSAQCVSCSHPTVYTKPACAASFCPRVMGGTPDGTALSPSSISTAPGKHCTNMCKPRPAARNIGKSGKPFFVPPADFLVTGGGGCIRHGVLRQLHSKVSHRHGRPGLVPSAEL